jgi:tetratricopeptide (TPR) repeat protein
MKNHWLALNTTSFVLASSLAAGVGARAQQTPPEKHAQEELQQDAMPRSGALVGLSNGETLWIALVEGKIQVVANEDYVIPRKDGFWRVRLGPQWAPPEGTTPAYGRLWAVPLKKGKNAVPWEVEKTTKSAEGEPQAAKSGDEATEDEEQELRFLGPDHISLHETRTFTSSGGKPGSTVLNRILRITDAPITNGHAAEGLLVQDATLLIPNNVRAEDLEACIEKLGNDNYGANRIEDQFEGTAEATYGITRSNQKWGYEFVLGYSTGSAWFSYTDCPISPVTPPEGVVGFDQLFPEWNVIKAAYPDAQDAFSSPTRDLVLIFRGSKLTVAPVGNGKIAKSLAEIDTNGHPVMVQWATGKNVGRWASELTPYFQSYSQQSAKNQPTSRALNDQGMKLMKEHNFTAALTQFIGADSIAKPKSALYANNAGFALYEMQQYADSISWFRKAIELDPNVPSRISI